MRSNFRLIFGSLFGVSIVMILTRSHVGGQVLFNIGLYSPLLGAIIGAALTLISVNIPISQKESIEPWLKREKLSWILIGCGCLAWAIGECFWRRYQALGENPFPSLADFGYASFPPLVFSGLALRLSSKSNQQRIFFLIDSLISTGALLSIAWFLLLGAIAQTTYDTEFAKILSLYYPTADTALVSGTVFLLMQESTQNYQAPVRRISLLILGLGLLVFATSDFIFNLQQNLGIYKDGTWVDLGWPLGIMTLGIAAYLRRFLPTTMAKVFVQRQKESTQRFRFEPVQLLPYFLLVVLFGVLVFNVLSFDKTQQNIRLVLVLATMIVIGLVIARQILTMLDNTRLLRRQSITLQELEQLNQSIEGRNKTLEAGVTHLKEIQTRLANGEVRARASAIDGELWPLAVGLNLMADRMMRMEHHQAQTQRLARDLDNFSQALMRAKRDEQFVPPISCLDFPEMQRLFLALGLKPVPGMHQPVPATPQPVSHTSDDHSSVSSYLRRKEVTNWSRDTP